MIDGCFFERGYSGIALRRLAAWSVSAIPAAMA